MTGRARHVILLHGLARTARSMRRMAERLQEAGYRTDNVDYPSTQHGVAYLTRYVEAAVARAGGHGVHFVTHSLGGILVRAYLAGRTAVPHGRIVMLAPPNQGSELVDRFGKTAWFRFVYGPAGTALHTGDTSVPNRLGPLPPRTGVIAGCRSLDPGALFVPGACDGKVAVARARGTGAADVLIVPYSHTFIMQREGVIRQTLHFLHSGCFVHGPADGRETQRLNAAGWPPGRQ